ncbi:uncharacterized protein LOC111089541 [Limulus polyphemus]|uniref:Uncharacterized protein LOC111089541 n=1 Tax=Limulus polyphemus TaxID=6850 RepID=A0ABM1TPZ9_LIMPO|nr:uncharacterized protein LOC111089541 [Limulus polyphemus]
MTGKMVFKLSRSRLEEVLGSEEGGRLHSHLTVQKKVSGYKTMNSHELQTILAERRRKIELSTDSTPTLSRNEVCKLFEGGVTRGSDSGDYCEPDRSNQNFDHEGYVPAPVDETQKMKITTDEWQRQQLIAEALAD